MTSLEEIKNVWNEFGRKDPLWAVLTEPDKKGQKWDPKEFFRIGAEEIASVMNHVASLAVDLSRKRALDFGCGVGRLTRALSPYFDEVIGVDISSSMLDNARRLNPDLDPGRFVINERDDLSQFGDDYFDFIYSNITLQHFDPTYSVRYIKEFMRILAPGGMLVFQLPARPARLGRRIVYRLFRQAWYEFIKLRAKSRAIMEIHSISQKRIVSLIGRNGGRVLDTIRDQYAGPEWVSLKYFIQSPKYNLCLLGARCPKVFHPNETRTINLVLENKNSRKGVGEPFDERIRLGGKLYGEYSDLHGQPLKEFRSDLLFPIAAGARIRRELGLDFRGVGKGRYLLFLDLVNEHKYWFSQFGFRPIIKKITVV
jgi:SAM-dependent methyltransferase